MANENDLHLDPIITKLLCFSDVLLSSGHMNQHLLVWDYVCMSCIKTKNIFPLLSQTEYAISRACHCGCHFRMLLQQLPTSTKVTKSLSSLALCLLSSVHRSATHQSYSCFLCFILSICSVAARHCTYKYRHVFIDRYIHHVVNKHGHYHPYQLILISLLHGLKAFVCLWKTHSLCGLKQTTG